MKTQEKWGLGLLVGSLVTWAFWSRRSAEFQKLQNVNLGEKDSGSTITVKPGMSIIVALPSNPSTGYGWYAATERFPLGRPEIPTPSGSSIPGSPKTETRIYRITPAMIGSHRVQLEYRQAWDQNTSPSKVFFFDAIVTP